ncbi:MAG TPA: TAT-variant-translocated molybdopterin oxidoreductase, partial [Alphaproteobacteria bacterium]|nr:TAT-variant-translocated molybdopterin oxidoreductase [Alphaproteobacteria bacterium]
MSRSASDSIRCALAGKSGREWWRSLEDLAGSPEFREHLLNEFPRQAAVWEGAVDRRSVLRFMGASFALAGLTGCGQPPAEEIVPHVRQPEYEVPGVPRYYATAVSLSGYGEGVLGETWEGRP